MRRRRRSGRKKRRRRRRVALSGESLCPLTARTPPASLGLLGSQSSPRAAHCCAPANFPCNKRGQKVERAPEGQCRRSRPLLSSILPHAPHPTPPFPACFTSAPALICRLTLTIKVVFLRQRVIKKRRRTRNHFPADRRSASPACGVTTKPHNTMQSCPVAAFPAV